MSYLATFEDIYKEVIRNVGLDPSKGSWVVLAKKWTNAAYQEINNRYPWPWIMSRASFKTTALESAGTVAVTQNSRTVTGSGTSFGSDHVGQIFMLQGDIGDKYRILSVASATSLSLEQPFIDDSQSGVAYHVWKKYYTLASDARQIIGMRRVNNLPVYFIFKDDFEKRYRHPHLGTFSYWSLWGFDYKKRSYSTGTVQAGDATSTLTGSGTSWLGNVEPGDKISVNSLIYHVSSIDSDTQITIIEKFTSSVAAGTSYSIVSEKAPTVILSGTPDPVELIEYEYHRKTFPLLDETEVPNIPQQFFDALVIGGMKYGFEYLGSPRDVQLSAQFEAEMKKAALYWDVSYKPDRFSFGAEAYARIY
jgi:hypothetical protein